MRSRTFNSVPEMREELQVVAKKYASGYKIIMESGDDRENKRIVRLTPDELGTLESIDGIIYVNDTSGNPVVVISDIRVVYTE